MHTFPFLCVNNKVSLDYSGGKKRQVKKISIITNTTVHLGFDGDFYKKKKKENERKNRKGNDQGLYKHGKTLIYWFIEQYNKRDSPMGLVGIGKPASFFFCKHRIHHHPSPGLLAVPSPLPYPLPKQSPWNMPKHSSYIFTLIPVSVHSIFNNLFLTSRLW